jgi:prepilin peptidase dependent protein B
MDMHTFRFDWNIRLSGVLNLFFKGKNMKKQIGYTIIEIMIALFLGLIVIGATISIYIATVGSSSNIIKSARLNHDLEAVMTLMINDIKRSGNWGGAVFMADSRNNPFTAATTDIQIPTANCILYTYDANSNGTVDANEYYGFKLINNSIQIRKTGTTTADCTDGTWAEFVNSAQLTITILTFSFSPVVNVLPATSGCLDETTTNLTNSTANIIACTAAAAGTNPADALGDNLTKKRVVNILLAGQLIIDPTVTKTLNGTVEVRNSQLCIKNATDCS